MHNLDRTTAEFEFEEALQEFEYENDGEYEADSEYEYESDNEYEDYEDNEWEAESDSEYEYESPFSEEEEMELASEMLETNSEAELDQFLGKIFKKIGRKAKRIGRRLAPKIFRGLRKLQRLQCL